MIRALVVATLLVAAPPAPPWRLAKERSASGKNAVLHVFVRWSPQNEFGRSTGVTVDPPVPKGMAFVVDQPRTQRAAVDWSAVCYPQREYAYTFQGTASITGRRLVYPKLYAKRVECDLYVNVQIRGTGKVTVRVYAR